MIDRFRAKLTYANVTATTALFIALGGTSYAAFTLPRNSVGDKQIRAAAVRSSEVKDRSLGVRDLSLAARSSLRGKRGAVGPSGPAGPAGVPAARYFAIVRADGSYARGNASSGGKAGPVGSYVVGFPAPVTSCAFTATRASVDGAPTAAGSVVVTENGTGVGVQTFDAAGNPADAGFHLTVSC